MDVYYIETGFDFSEIIRGDYSVPPEEGNVSALLF